MKEFKRYLEGLEKDLSRASKKYSNREIAQGVGFVAAGIHEALNYLAIVRKVIEKTERVVAKRNDVSENALFQTSYRMSVFYFSIDLNPFKYELILYYEFTY